MIQVITAWNGLAISAFASASQILRQQPQRSPSFPVDAVDASVYLEAAVAAAAFVRKHLWDPASQRLRRSYCSGPSVVEGELYVSVFYDLMMFRQVLLHAEKVMHHKVG